MGYHLRNLFILRNLRSICVIFFNLRNPIYI